MKKKLPLLTFIATLILAVTGHTQLFKISLEEKAKASTLIAEGKVVAQKSFWNDAHTMIFTANTVEVYKTFKGKVTARTIEVMTQGGSVGTNAIEVSDLLTLHTGQTGIFFCFENTANIKSPTRQTLYDVFSSRQGFLEYNYTKNVAYAPFAKYYDIENNLYSLIKQQTGEGESVVDPGYSVSKMLRVKATASSNGVEGIFGAPSITSFSPATVHAGALNDPANSTLTINGSGFGNTPGGSAAVLFKDGNNDNTDPDLQVAYNSFYIVSWTNTKIVVKVPSRAATGKIAVVLNDGTTTATSSADLDVFFAVLNFGFHITSVSPKIDTTFICEPRLMNNNALGGYSYKFSRDTAGKGINFATDPASTTFGRAVDTWREIAGANLKAGGTTTIQKMADDGTNVVAYDNLNTGVPPMAEGVLEVTYSYGTICYLPTSPVTIYTAQKTGFDILIRNPKVSSGPTVNIISGPCFPDVNSYDLETIILHELGHALNLTHINDGYEQSPDPGIHINPGKIMHYAIVNYADRRSPDASAYQGALYTITPQGNIFGDCPNNGPMQPLATSNIANDECPLLFPTTPTTPGTVVKFDLAHATSNKHKDPSFTQVNCQGSGTFVTNNAYYAIKTTGINNGTLSLSISGYATTPAEEASCTGQGVRMAIYRTDACPVGQAFPAPVACATFTGNGSLANVTGLSANATYLLYFDGIRNTKATFNVTFGGSALPIVLADFSGEYLHGANNLYIDIAQAFNVKNVAIEKSFDGNNFSQLGLLNVPSTQLAGKHTYIDAQPYTGKNYYRLKITDNDGAYQYSKIIVLQNSLNKATYLYPNPAKGNAYISFSGQAAGKYQVMLYSADGKMLSTHSISLTMANQTINLPLGNTAAGVYMVKVIDSNGKSVLQQKLVKQ